MGTPSTLPEGTHAARVRSGAAVLETEEGRLVGEVQLQPGGWYFTPHGYDRLFVALAQWQRNLDVAVARMEASSGLLQARVDDKPTCPSCFLPVGAALVVGFLAGRAFTRWPERKEAPHASPPP